MKASVAIEKIAARRKCMIKRRAGLLELKNRPDLRVLFHKLLISQDYTPKEYYSRFGNSCPAVNSGVLK